MLQRTLPAGFIAHSQWLHEIKHDGFRIIARKTGRQPLHAARGPFGDGKAIFNYFHEG
jgi:ATP-dependent DNA ligase